MSKVFDEQSKEIRNYLLGNLEDESRLRQIEENILLDDNFGEQLSIAEDELIDDYLENTLTENERSRFSQFYLAAAENKQKLRFNQNLRKYLALHSAAENDKNTAQTKAFFTLDWRKLFSPKPLAAAFLVLLFVGGSLIIWRTVFDSSSENQGLAQLQTAYRSQRPIQSRITGFDYAPMSGTRGANGVKPDDSARDRAKGLLLTAAGENATAENLQALGKFYLTEKDFGRAAENFAKAAESSPDNARLQSDWGAALLEAGKKAALNQDETTKTKLLEQSLPHLERASTLDSKLPEPLFNRALCLQLLSRTDQAKQAWRDYLILDPNSPWTVEAAANLKILKSKSN